MRVTGVVLVAGVLLGTLAGCDITTTPGPPQVFATGGIATAVPVPKASATPVTCSTGKATLVKSNARFMLVGDCHVVTITGSSDQVSGGDITTLTIKGFFDSVVAQRVGTVKIVGDSNTVSATHIGATNVRGTYNRVIASN